MESHRRRGRDDRICSRAMCSEAVRSAMLVEMTGAARVLQVIVDWGRYAELFAYDYQTGVFSAANPGEDKTMEVH